MYLEISKILSADENIAKCNICCGLVIVLSFVVYSISFAQSVLGDSSESLIPECSNMCVWRSPGEKPSDAKARIEGAIGCRATSLLTRLSGCEEQWRLEKRFLEAHEGSLILNAYVPQCRRKGGCRIGNKDLKYGDVIGASGVTVSTGIDLGQQSADGTREILDEYIDEFGNVNNVDIENLLLKLDRYFGKKKDDAKAELDKEYENGNKGLSITDAEARILADSFIIRYRNNTRNRFDFISSDNMVFKKLPIEAQTVLVDWVYQMGVGVNGSPRSEFWSYVKKGEWRKLADWLDEQSDYPGRRQDQARWINAAIAAGDLPKEGNPCPDEEI